MKKIFALLMTFALLLMTGCGGGDNKVSDSNKIKMGMITRLNVSEENFEGFVKQVEETLNVSIASHKPVYFDNLNSMLAALQAGQIQEISTYTSVARYMIAKDPHYALLEDHSLEFIDSFCFALREEDTELKDSLNMVIKEMQDDGTLGKLAKEYITDIKTDSEPPAIELPHFDGADTIKVAVTGDLPPLDYVSQDARAAALTSKQADVIFWAIVPVSEIIPADSDTPAGVVVTAPYFKDKVVHMTFKAETK